MEFKTFSLIERIENIKGTWFVWECEAEDELGNVVKGTIEGDLWGELYEPDSFEADE